MVVVIFSCTSRPELFEWSDCPYYPLAGLQYAGFGEFGGPLQQGSHGFSPPAQISGVNPEDDLYDARATVPGEYIDHRVRNGREGVFIKARRSRLDLVALAGEPSRRKMEIMGEVRAAGV